MVMHHLNSQEYTLFWGYFVLEIIVTDSTHSKSAIILANVCACTTRMFNPGENTGTIIWTRLKHKLILLK